MNFNNDYTKIDITKNKKKTLTSCRSCHPSLWIRRRRFVSRLVKIRLSIWEKKNRGKKRRKFNLSILQRRRPRERERERVEEIVAFLNSRLQGL